MGSWHPVANLRDYVSQHPPAVTFFLCLLTLALSLIYLGSYVQSHTQPNPDAQDWNHLLASLSRLQLCTTNVTKDELVTGPPPVTHLSLQVLLALSSASQSLKGLGLHTTLSASHLGLTGDGAVNVTVTLQFFSPPAGKNPFTCLTISAPSSILPQTLLPPQCPTDEKTVSPVQVDAMETGSPSPTASPRTCYSLESTYDPLLTVMLTQEQQSVAVRHLEQTGVFLLGVCVLLCLSSTVSHSRRHQGNGLDPHRQILIDS